MVVSQIELEERCFDKNVKIAERTKLLEKKMNKLFFDRWCTRKKKKVIIIYFSEIKVLVPYGEFIEGWDRYLECDGHAWNYSYAKIYFTKDIIEDIIKRYTENSYDIFFGKTFFGDKYFEFK